MIYRERTRIPNQDLSAPTSEPPVVVAAAVHREQCLFVIGRGLALIPDLYPRHEEEEEEEEKEEREKQWMSSKADERNNEFM